MRQKTTTLGESNARKNFFEGQNSRTNSSILVGTAAVAAVCFSLIPAHAANALDLGRYRQIWGDEFEGGAGSRPAPHWYYFDGWGSGKWRDTYYTDRDAYLDGSGNLFMRARVRDGKFD